MRGFVLVVAVFACGSHLTAQDALPPDVLKHLKNASVFINCEIGPLQATGTGFLVRVDSNVGYIITNHHVVEEPELPRPNPRAKSKSQPQQDDSDDGPLSEIPGRGSSDNFRDAWKIRTVFNSGQSNERTFPAKVVAADAARDLAVLRIEANDLPKPVEFRA